MQAPIGHWWLWLASLWIGTQLSTWGHLAVGITYIVPLGMEGFVCACKLRAPILQGLFWGAQLATLRFQHLLTLWLFLTCVGVALVAVSGETLEQARSVSV